MLALDRPSPWGRNIRRLSKLTLGGLFPPVLDDLWDPRTQVAESAGIAQYHTHHHGRLIRRLRVGHIDRVRRRVRANDLTADEPRQEAQQVYEDEAQRVGHPRAPLRRRVLARHDSPQRVQARRVPADRVLSLATREPTVHGTGGAPARDEGLLLGRGPAVVLGERLLVAAAGVDGVVVEALRDHDDVGEAEVDADGDGGGCEIGHESACG